MYSQFWKDTLINTKTCNGHIVGNCPICNEVGGHFYANVLTGCWDCKKCQASGNAWTFLRHHKGMNNVQIFRAFNQYGIDAEHCTEVYPERIQPRIFDKKVIENFCSKLTDETINEFSLERGISAEILRKYQLGINENGEFTLPLYDEKYNLRNILRKKNGGSTMKNLKIFAVALAVMMVACSALALAHTGYKGHRATNHQNDIPGAHPDPRCSESWWDDKIVVGDWYFTISNKIWARVPKFMHHCDD